MTRFYFHLTVDDEYFPDPTGRDFNDLTEAHSQAIRLAKRVILFFERQNKTTRSARHVVTIEDKNGEIPLSVIFALRKHDQRCPTGRDTASS